VVRKLSRSTRHDWLYLITVFRGFQTNNKAFPVRVNQPGDVAFVSPNRVAVRPASNNSQAALVPQIIHDSYGPDCFQ
jgi:hypothetical protein